MGKYIIDIDKKNICTDDEGSQLAITVKINDASAIFCTEIPLTPYTEPDLEQVRKEAYEKGKMDAYVEDSKNITVLKEEAEEAYQRGLSDAWECARKLVLDTNHGGLTNYEIEEIFGVDEEQTIINYSASECIEKIRQYKQEKEEDGLRQNIQTIVDQCGYSLDEIAEVLAKMKENSDGNL